MNPSEPEEVATRAIGGLALIGTAGLSIFSIGVLIRFGIGWGLMAFGASVGLVAACLMIAIAVMDEA